MPARSDSVYLDYNATTPLCNAARASISDALEALGNASSVHSFGRSVRARIEDARDKVAKLSEVDSQAVTFTSGATEANALVIGGLQSSGTAKSVLCSAIEHPSVLENVAPDKIVRVTNEGVVDLDHLDASLREHAAPALVCIMAANNETGVVQPIEQAKEIITAHGGYLFCDMVQTPGKIPVQEFSRNADVYSVSAHKFGGPAGIGALVNPRGLEIAPSFHGGGQERKVRSGTENFLGIVGFGAAAQNVANLGIDESIRQRRDSLEQRLLASCPEAVIFGRSQARLPNTICVATPQVTSQQQLIKLDLAGFAVSAGSACSSGKIAKSHVLVAMGVSDLLAGTAIRISIGRETTQEELERFADTWSKL